MISIVIPALNEENYLPRLIISIRKQAYKDYEIIVADAGSKDKTRKIASMLGCKVVEGGNISFGRNNGARHAKGEWILFLDADVILENDFLGSIMRLQKKKGFDVCALKTMPITDNLLDRALWHIGGFIQFFSSWLKPLGCGAGILVRKRVHDKTLFDETGILGEDIEYLGRVSKNGKFIFLLSPSIEMSNRRFEHTGRLSSIWIWAKWTFNYYLGRPNRISDEYEYGNY